MNVKNFLLSYYANKGVSLDDTFTTVIKNYRISLVYAIYQETFTSYYISQLNSFFNNIIHSKILYCEQCINNYQINLSTCINGHNVSNIAISFDSLFQFFEEMLIKEKTLNAKFEHMKAIKINPNYYLSRKISSHFITNISSLMKLRLFILLEKFKAEKNINDPNIIIPQNIKQIIKSLLLGEVYKNIISSFIKTEIDLNLSYYISSHTSQIVPDLIKMFSNYYLEWSFLNNEIDPISLSLIDSMKQRYKETFITYLKQNFMKIKIEKFFDIISQFPDSSPTLLDIKYCINSYDPSLFVNSIKSQLSSRLLTPGISTRLIIEIFIRIIKIMKAIEPGSYMLSSISEPIKSYLRMRKDTMQWIITTILSEDDSNILEDMSKAYVRNVKSYDLDYLSSDEEPENWEPTYGDAADFKSKSTDIISVLVNIFGSPEKFMEQYKRMLSERRITDDNFSLENEIKNLELLKLKFGENLLQSCDVIIKDIKDSMKLNSTDIKDVLINCLVINKNYWPFINNNSFEINNIEPQIDTTSGLPLTAYDNFLQEIRKHIDYYKTQFTKKKFCRNLSLYSNVGYANMTLTFRNGEFTFVVSPLSGFIIKMFDKENKAMFPKYTIDYIAEKLKADADDVKKKINFWVTKGVLKEILDNEGNVQYFEPNDYFKNVENNDVIIEEEIYNFEYPVEATNGKLIENSIVSIIKNSGPKNFEQLYKNLIMSYQLDISEIKLKDLLGKMTLEQKIFKEGENYKLIITN